MDEKFEMKFGFLDINESVPYLKYANREVIRFEESKIKRIAYKNLITGVINEPSKLYKEYYP